MRSAVFVKGLTKTYGHHVAVQDFHLDVPKGQIFGLLGHENDCLKRLACNFK